MQFLKKNLNIGKSIGKKGFSLYIMYKKTIIKYI